MNNLLSSTGGFMNGIASLKNIIMGRMNGFIFIANSTYLGFTYEKMMRNGSMIFILIVVNINYKT